MNFEDLAEQLQPNGHYITIAKQSYHEYFMSFLEAMECLGIVLEQKALIKLINEKLQFRPQRFNEKSFVQMACETSVNAFFARQFPESFSYEKKINPENQMDIDCCFRDLEFEYCIEVKCSDFSSKEAIDNQYALKIGTAGRIPDHKTEMGRLFQLLELGVSKVDNVPNRILASKNMDNNLKDFLLSAHQKFSPYEHENQVNILVVCCGDPRDMQQWVHYVFGHEGLFTPYSFWPQIDYCRVDLIVLTNLYHRHHKFTQKPNIKNHWFLDQAFNLILCNPFRRIDNKTAIMHFNKILPNYSERIKDYNPPGDVPECVKDTFRIPYFVKEILEQNSVFLF